MHPDYQDAEDGFGIATYCSDSLLDQIFAVRSDTPLHIAAIEAEMTVLQLLLGSKASMQIKNVVGYKACVFSSSRGPWAVTPRRRLRPRISPTSSPSGLQVHGAALRSNVRKLRRRCVPNSRPCRWQSDGQRRAHAARLRTALREGRGRVSPRQGKAGDVRFASDRGG